MSTAPIDNSFYADPQGVSALRRDARPNDPEAIKAAARQFEALFTSMMLKSMRDATPKDSLFGSDQQDFYQDMFDQQLASQLSKGKGLGLADSLVQQLMRTGLQAPSKTAPREALFVNRQLVMAGAAFRSPDLPEASSEENAADLGFVTKLSTVAGALKSGRNRPLT